MSKGHQPGITGEDIPSNSHHGPNGHHGQNQLVILVIDQIGQQQVNQPQQKNGFDLTGRLVALHLDSFDVFAKQALRAEQNDQQENHEDHCVLQLQGQKEVDIC